MKSEPVRPATTSSIAPACPVSHTTQNPSYIPCDYAYEDDAMCMNTKLLQEIKMLLVAILLLKLICLIRK